MPTRASWIDFADPDSAVDTAFVVECVERISSLDSHARGKQLSYEALQVGGGAHVLEVGCGTGIDLLALAELVAPDGQVVGVDASQEAISRAADRTAGASQVSCQVASAEDLPFPDETFDGARLDRVLQHLAAPITALCEASRTVRQGGRVVAAEVSLRGPVPRRPGRRLPSDGLAAFLPIVAHRAGLQDVTTMIHEEPLTAPEQDVLRALYASIELGRPAGPLSLSFTHAVTVIVSGLAPGASQEPVAPRRAS